MKSSESIAKPIDQLLCCGQWITIYPWFDLRGNSPEFDRLYKSYVYTRIRCCIPDDQEEFARELNLAIQPELEEWEHEFPDAISRGHFSSHEEDRLAREYELTDPGELDSTIDEVLSMHMDFEGHLLNGQLSNEYISRKKWGNLTNNKMPPPTPEYLRIKAFAIARKALKSAVSRHLKKQDK